MRQLGLMRNFALTCLVAWSVGAEPRNAGYVIDRFPWIKPEPDYNLVALGQSQQSPPHTIGNVTQISKTGTASFLIECGVDKVRIQFIREDIVRIWVGWNGSFTDPASDDVVVGKPKEGLEAVMSAGVGHYDFAAATTPVVRLRAETLPLRFTLFDHGGKILWTEAQGLSVNTSSTFQTLVADARSRQEAEYGSESEQEFFFGGGMQNGRFSHRGHRIRISRGSWKDGDNPNAAPVYMSSYGYGVYRNTWKPGYYDFSGKQMVLGHGESRFDAYYFASGTPGDFKALLGAYTFLTGPPFMPPIYGLGLGDSDCYHNKRHGNDTRVVEAVAAKYRELDMPGAWFLPNDGYGCGYGVGPAKFPTNFTVLDEVVASLSSKYGFQTGLWSSTGLPNISREVNGSGVRVFKTDVGWIGKGYKYAFDAVKLCADGIENHSSGRRFVWTVEGWAGTHRYAVMWTGDDAGSFDYIRWQIPTYIGSGFSAQAHVSGDVDGIFGGSPETYVRDLQFKCFMTVVMTMSGWAANPDKQPWAWGEPYTSINRLYLKLKSRLTPYFYTLSREAYDTGVPIVRAMALEFPEDSNVSQLYANNTGSSQQFMSGPYLLVAPVYEPLKLTTVRDGIYLPEGQWVDFWTGSIYGGGSVINGYPVPLETLPVFVRAGAILPMWPDMLFPGQKPGSPLTLDIYPSGSQQFDMYEDDGVTREALEQKGRSQATRITCQAPPKAMKEGGNVTCMVAPQAGAYSGQLAARSYELVFHLRHSPKMVLFSCNESKGNTTLPHQESLSALDFASEGWAFSSAVQAGLLRVKIKALNIFTSFQVIVVASSQAAPQVASTFASSLVELDHDPAIDRASVVI